MRFIFTMVASVLGPVNLDKSGGFKVKHQTLWVIISFIAAVLALIFRDWFARQIIDFQNTVWGFNFGEREIKASKIAIIITGSAFILFDILAILGIIKLR